MMANMGWIAGAASLLQVMGGLMSAKEAKISGQRAQAAYEFQAWQAEQQAGTAIAISQRQAAEEARQGRLAASRMLAVAAASGGSASDPTIMRLIGANAGESAYRAQVALYEGEERSRQLRFDAAAGRVSGAWARVQGADRAAGLSLSAAGAGARGAMSLYARYGMNGPSGDAALIEDQVPGQYSTVNRQYG